MDPMRHAPCILLIAMMCAGCQSNAGTGALVGAGIGALAGGAIGSSSHARAGEGAVLGAAVGAGSGALIGHSMDRSEQRSTYAVHNEAPRPITLEQVKAWSARGVREQVIIERIERSGTVFHLTAADESDLYEAGVSDAVIRAMRDTARR